MNEFVTLLPSTVKDTTDFLQKCSLIKNIPEGAFVVTWDVIGLYPNIPIDEGIKASKWMLNKHRKGMVNPSNESVIKLLKLVLTCNNFEFNGEHYKQIKGTAMGTKVAPTFANIFMGKFEHDYVYTHPLYSKVLMWLRFIDDIFFIFTGTLIELKQFFHDLNHTRLKSIKFTMDYSNEKINFLDTTIRIENGSLVSNLYTKPTDSHSYLLYNSCHPKHILASIPYSQFLRIRRICTYWTDFLSNSMALVNYFTARNYPIAEIMDSLVKVNKIDRDTALKGAPTNPPPEDVKHKFYLINTYNPSNPDIKGIVTKHWQKFGRVKSTRVLLDTQIVFGYRNCQNIQDKIVRAKIHPPGGAPTKTPPKPCNRKSTCRYCPKICHSGTITNNQNGRSYRTMVKTNCQSSNLVYAISCNLCGIQYVGKTKNTIVKRFGTHFYDIEKKHDTTVARHFNDHGVTKDLPFQIHVLEFIHRNPATKEGAEILDEHEKMWMGRLNTYYPKGLNIQD